MSHGLSRRERLCKSSQFLNVRQSGTSVKTPSFWLQMSTGSGRISKLGVIATKKTGNAVHRNHAKRIVRELYRTHKSLLPEIVDIVVIPNKAIFKMVHSQLTSSFKDALVKASNRL